MPYKDPVRQARALRTMKRTARHGTDWRGIIEYYKRTCANSNDVRLADLCVETETLELHEPFGEDKRRAVTIHHQGIMQMRILLCRPCHSREHQFRFAPTRGNDSRYLEDTDTEILELNPDWGTAQQMWYNKYRVGESLGMGLSQKVGSDDPNA